MPLLIEQLDLNRCPTCKIDSPNLHVMFAGETNNYLSNNRRFWKIYSCKRCGGMIVAASNIDRGTIIEMYPHQISLDESIPERARTFLDQAMNSIHAPSGSIMLSASAVDGMLKARGYVSGSLYSRIDKSKQNHLITHEMAEWAHAIRLEANDQRHADENAPLPNEADAQRCVDFALALGQFLFVLPSRVAKGINNAMTVGCV